MLMMGVGAEEQQVGITGDGFAYFRSDAEETSYCDRV
jgi:hypothetical protein